MDQVQTVRAMAKTLTKSQKEVIEQRKKKITHQRKSPSSSQGEGTSKAKWKGTDPLKWGNVNISQESLNIEAQVAAFRSIVQERQTIEWPRAMVAKETHQVAYRDLRSPPTHLLAASRPVAQLGQDSYLGRALCEVGRSSSRKESCRNKKSTPPSSQPSSSDGELSGSESGSSTDENSWKRWSNRHGHNQWRRRASSSSSRASNLVIKPIAPKEYNGGADARLYHHFVRESGAYLCDGKVKGRCQIFLLSFGDIPERDQVLKFWNGSQPIIQKSLWQDTLNPETSSWAIVVSQTDEMLALV